LPDAAGGDPHAVSDSSTNTKGIPLYKTFEFIHLANLENNGNSANFATRKQAGYRKFAANFRLVSHESPIFLC